MDKKEIFKAILETTKVVAQPIAVEKIYKKMFGHHFYSPKYLSFSNSDFPGLKYEKHPFVSHDKKRLVGYIYSQKSPQNKGIFVFCHGYGGGGHHCYLDLINTVVKLGYIVFAYDATANDESDGDDIKGFTQGLLDADKAISYVESRKEYKDMPLYLMGHSWGAYSASNALEFHPRVKGLIAFSGFNLSTSIFQANGELYAGDASKEFYSYIVERERKLFGALSYHTAIESFNKSKAKICIIHSSDDATVPISAGYDIYHKEFGKDKRFKFVRFSSRGHGTVFYTLQGKKYYDSIEKAYNKFCKDKEKTLEEKEAFLKENIDRKKWKNMVDVDLVKDCIKFIK